MGNAIVEYQKLSEACFVLRTLKGVKGVKTNPHDLGFFSLFFHNIQKWVKCTKLLTKSDWGAVVAFKLVHGGPGFNPQLGLG